MQLITSLNGVVNFFHIQNEYQSQEYFDWFLSAIKHRRHSKKKKLIGIELIYIAHENNFQFPMNQPQKCVKIFSMWSTEQWKLKLKEIWDQFTWDCTKLCGWIWGIESFSTCNFNLVQRNSIWIDWNSGLMSAAAWKFRKKKLNKNSVLTLCGASSA